MDSRPTRRPVDEGNERTIPPVEVYHLTTDVYPPLLHEKLFLPKILAKIHAMTPITAVENQDVHRGKNPYY